MVRRLFAGVLGGLGLAVLFRRLRGKASPTGVDPAAELRRKLEESRVPPGEREEFEEGETPIDQAEAPADLAARRRAVHDRGRSALGDMRTEPPAGES